MKDGKYIADFNFNKKDYQASFDNDMIFIDVDNTYIQYNKSLKLLIIASKKDTVKYSYNKNICENGSCQKYEDLIKEFKKQFLE